jgi:hypothetical protein
LKQEGLSTELLINGGCKFSSAEFLENILGNLPGPLLNPRPICPFSVLKKWGNCHCRTSMKKWTMLSHGKYIDFCKT